MKKTAKRPLIGVIILLVPMLFIAACKQVGGIRPPEPTPASNEIITGQPQLITFTELEADPFQYQNKLIRVTGSYISLPVVACDPFSGPNPAWSMVADDLRLDTLGFEGLLYQLAQPETTLTVDGVLRRYDGPLGCGKRPSDGVLWYLEALQIVQPNPLVLAESDLGGNSGIVPPPFPTGTPPSPAIEETPELEPTPGPGTPSRTPTATSDGIATITPTGTTEAEETVPVETATRTPTPTQTQTPVLTGTAGPGTSTPSPTPQSGPTTAPLPTATSGGGGGGGYPNPTVTSYP